MEFLRFAILGLASGSITALLAQALVLTYRASGILNLGQSSFLLVGAYGSYQLEKWGWPRGLAVVVAVLGCAVAGALVYAVAIEPLKRSSALTRIIATLAVVTITQSAAVLIFGVQILSEPSWLPTRPITLFHGMTLGLDRYLILLVGLGCAGVLWFVYRYTGFGRLASAVAENPRIVASMGHSPDRVAVVNWALGAALAGFAGTLVGPILYLVPTQLILLIVPALAAALVGGFSSFPLTLAAALGIGVAESLLQRYVSTPGASTAVPLLIVVAWLVVRGRGLPLRSHILDRLPAVGSGRIRPVPLGLVMVGLYALIFYGMSGEIVSAFTFTVISAIICVSIVVISGFAGQLSLAQYVLAGVGALVAVKLSPHMPTPLAAIVAILATALVGAVIAVPSLRTRGVTLAVVTLGLGSVLYDGLLNNTKINGGQAGLTANTPELFGWSFDPTLYPQRTAAVALACLALVGIVVANLRRGAIGRRLIAVRSNERAAAALGISVSVSKVYAFALAASIAALGGVLISYEQSTILTPQFDVFTSLLIVGVTVAGGVGMVGGALVGATLIPNGLVGQLLSGVPDINTYLPLVGGVILLLSLRSAPDGIFEDVRAKGAAAAGWLASRLSRRPAEAEAGDDTSRRRRLEQLAGGHASRPATSARARGGPGVLRVRELSVRFGGVIALDGVSIEVRPGQVHGLIGPNGAGKTTLIDAISGFAPIAGGTVHLGEERVDGLVAHRRARRRLVRSFQSVDLFDDLTVLENIAVACDDSRPWRYLTDLVWPARVRVSPPALEAIEVCELADYLYVRPGELPFGRRRMVAIARALASSPAVLLLDEPAAGLGDREAGEVGALIRSVADQGVAVLLVEHRIDLIARCCDSVTVLSAGRHLASGPPAEVLTRPDVLDAYLGAQSAGPDRSQPGSEQVSPADGQVGPRRKEVVTAGRRAASENGTRRVANSE